MVYLDFNTGEPATSQGTPIRKPSAAAFPTCTGLTGRKARDAEEGGLFGDEGEMSEAEAAVTQASTATARRIEPEPVPRVQRAGGSGVRRGRHHGVPRGWQGRGGAWLGHRWRRVGVRRLVKDLRQHWAAFTGMCANASIVSAHAHMCA